MLDNYGKHIAEGVDSILGEAEGALVLLHWRRRIA